MKRKRQKRKVIDIIFEDWFENSLPPWEFGILSEIYDELEEQITEIERDEIYN